MSSTYAELVLLAVPQRPPGPSWTVAESKIGMTLPGDYKELLDRTGAVTVDGYLCLTGPDLSDRATSIAQLVEEREWAWTRFRAGGVPLREEFFAAGGRLLAPAAVDAIDFYWHAGPEVPPDDWRVVVVDADLWRAATPTAAMRQGSACSTLPMVGGHRSLRRARRMVWVRLCVVWRHRFPTSRSFPPKSVWTAGRPDASRRPRMVGSSGSASRTRWTPRARVGGRHRC